MMQFMLTIIVLLRMHKKMDVIVYFFLYKVNIVLLNNPKFNNKYFKNRYIRR